jgi:hypothetical protein
VAEWLTFLCARTTPREMERQTSRVSAIKEQFETLSAKGIDVAKEASSCPLLFLFFAWLVRPLPLLMGRQKNEAKLINN